jgi:hypothetical protein
MPRPASCTCDTPGGCERWNIDASPPVRRFNIIELVVIIIMMSFLFSAGT